MLTGKNMVYLWYKFFKSSNNLNYFVKNNQGQVFSIDLLFALIIITVVIGMSANAVDEVGFKISDYSAGKSLDRIVTEAADILINTPGTLDWEKSNSTSYVTPGLAQDNNGISNTTKVLSFTKILKLTDSPG